MAEVVESVNELYKAQNWRGVVALEATASAAAAQLREGKLSNVAADLYWKLGNSYLVLEEYAKSIQLNEQALLISELTGDLEGQWHACFNLGSCYLSEGEYAKSIKLHEQCLVMVEEMGDKGKKGQTLSNLGICYDSLLQYNKAIELHEQSRAIAEEVGDRAEMGRACINIANCHEALGEYDSAIRMVKRARVIKQEVGDRPGEVKALQILGRCKTAMGEYAQAITCNDERLHILEETHLVHEKVGSMLAQGVNLWAQARVTAKAISSDMPYLSGLSPSYMDSMHDASGWLKNALRMAQICGFGEQENALVHLSFLAFDTGEEEQALDYLKQYLQVQVDGAGSHCRGCDQVRGDDAPMLTCSGCSVARFCNKDHQKMASQNSVSGRNTAVRHKDICSLLGKWRQVVKGNATTESCTADLLEFLRRDVWWKGKTPVSTDSGPRVKQAH